MKSKPPKRSHRPRNRQDASATGDAGLWLFGLHAVRDALANPNRVIHRLIATQNGLARLEGLADQRGIETEISDARKFTAPLDAGSVHQGVAMRVSPLEWGSVSELCAPRGDAPLTVLLDRVTDPHNVGAILRSAEVFGARAVIGPHRHSAPETGALAKAASGALERQPYLRVPNLARAMTALKEMGYVLVGLDGQADADISDAIAEASDQPLGLVFGAEGPGLRQLTRETCSSLARIPARAAFGSLNVSNAAAVALYAAHSRKTDDN